MKVAMMRKNLYYIVLFSFFIARPAWGRITGLNNIPTADVVPEKVLVLQYWGHLGNDNVPDHFGGFKYGLMKNVEIGLDGRFFPEKALEETLAGQVKVRFELSSKLAVAAGIGDLGDRARNGREYPYGVLSQDFGLFRIHFGGTFQKDNEGIFAGIDKTIKFLERDLTFRSDIIQTNDQDDITTSAGFIYDLGHNFLIESWVSFPTESGKENIVTTVLNYVIKF
jgi:hypothetical protein